MSAYIVAYDLTPERGYSDLYKLIESYEVSIRITESSWVIGTESTAIEIKDNLVKALDDKDRLFVAPIGELWAGKNTPGGIGGLWPNS